MPIAERRGCALWQNGILVNKDRNFDIYQTASPLSDIRSQSSTYQRILQLAIKKTYGNLACGLVISGGTYKLLLGLFSGSGLVSGSVNLPPSAPNLGQEATVIGNSFGLRCDRMI